MKMRWLEIGLLKRPSRQVARDEQCRVKRPKQLSAQSPDEQLGPDHGQRFVLVRSALPQTLLESPYHRQAWEPRRHGRNANGEMCRSKSYWRLAKEVAVAH